MKFYVRIYTKLHTLGALKLKAFKFQSTVVSKVAREAIALHIHMTPSMYACEFEEKGLHNKDDLMLCFLQHIVSWL
jgi:hypothetical protein